MLTTPNLSENGWRGDDCPCYLLLWMMNDGGLLNTNLKWQWVQWVLRACILSSNAEGSSLGYALVSYYERWERMSMVWYKSKYQSLILIAGDRIEDRGLIQEQKQGAVTSDMLRMWMVVSWCSTSHVVATRIRWRLCRGSNSFLLWQQEKLWKQK